MSRALLAILLLAACNDPAPESPTAAPASKTPSTSEALSPVEGPVRPAVLTPSPVEEPARLYLVLGGDVMLQDQIHDIARLRGQGDLAAGYAWFLHALQPLLDDLRTRGDVRLVVNLESPVATQRNEPQSFPPLFNGPPEALQGFHSAGVDVVTLANNHALDQGRSGLAETIARARAAGLSTAGAGKDGAEARAPLVIGEAPRVALLAYYLRPRPKPDPPAGYRVAILDERSIDEVAAARASSDAVVVTVHWVGEFRTTPRDEWVEWAHRLVLAGADAVVCHGPHVLGPSQIVETPDGRQALVAYSVGNLVSNMGWEVYPMRSLDPGKDSSQRIEAREQALAVLELTVSTTQPLTAVTLVPVFLMDNRYAIHRKGAGPRLIYPLPLPNCVPPDPVPCFPASKPSECTSLTGMLEDLVSRPTFEGFCQPRAADAAM